MTASRADYQHGCRSDDCRTANAIYIAKTRGRRVPPLVAAGRTREHIRLLLAADVSMRQIARRAGVTDSLVRRILGRCCGGPTKRVRRETQNRILAVRPHNITLNETARPDPEPWWLELTRIPAGLDLTWKQHGTCLDPDIPTDVFFPGRGDLQTLRAAQDICKACPVRQPCLQFALATEAEGIWGGTTHQQREQLLGKRAGPPP